MENEVRWHTSILGVCQWPPLRVYKWFGKCNLYVNFPFSILNSPLLHEIA